MESPPTTTIWHCERFFVDCTKAFEADETLGHPREEEALILVNGEFPTDYRFTNFWKKAKLKICADGGSTRLYHWDKNQLYIPNYIVGDLDSSNSTVIDHYKRKAVDVVHEADQETTDLQKALTLIKKLETGIPHETITIFGGLGGCFSHQLANVNNLFHYPSRRVFLVSKKNVSFLLAKGKHVISIAPKKLPSYYKPQGDSDEEKLADYKRLLDLDWKSSKVVHCSLMPVGEKCQNVRTSGLRWELDGSQLAFGGLVSVSNEMLHTILECEVSSPVLFTFDFRDAH